MTWRLAQVLPLLTRQLLSSVLPRHRATVLLVVGVLTGMLVSTGGVALATPDRWDGLVPPPLVDSPESLPEALPRADDDPAVMVAEPAPVDPGAVAAPATTPVVALDPGELPLVPARDEQGNPVRFAMSGGVDLYVPGDGVKMLGFHEAGTPRVFPMVPTGTLTDNLNTRVTAPEDRGEAEYMVLPTRMRRHGGTTSVDIAMEPGVPVLSPVTGTVVTAQPYRLYGRTHDVLLEIVPDSAPYARVKILHLKGVPLAPGARVVAGETMIAESARQLPFASQIDRFAGHGPHAHIEVLDSSRRRS